VRGKGFDPKTVYRFDEESGTYNIDIRIGSYGDLYNELDFSPVYKRDLDKDLVEFLESCVYEIPLNEAVAVNFFLEGAERDPESEERARVVFRNYFSYSVRWEYSQRRELFKGIALYGPLGAVLLLFGFFSRKVFVRETVGTSILQEGFFIGAWVLLWELFSTLFFDFRRYSRKIRRYGKLEKARISFEIP
jgi:hypothetical protein